MVFCQYSNVQQCKKSSDISHCAPADDNNRDVKFSKKVAMNILNYRYSMKLESSTFSHLPKCTTQVHHITFTFKSAYPLPLITKIDRLNLKRHGIHSFTPWNVPNFKINFDCREGWMESTTYNQSIFSLNCRSGNQAKLAKLLRRWIPRGTIYNY